MARRHLHRPAPAGPTTPRCVVRTPAGRGLRTHRNGTSVRAHVATSRACQNGAMPTPRRTATATTAGASRRPGLRLLSSVPLFSGLSQAHLRTLAGLAGEVRYGPGRMIVKAGAPGVAFYIITDGQAKVLKGKIATARREATLGPGDFFGEMALLDGGPRTASVVAETPLTTIRIERAEFRKVLRDEPDIALKLLEGMAVRMRGLLSAPSL